MIKINFFILFVLVFGHPITAFSQEELDFLCIEGTLPKDVQWQQVGQDMQAFTMTLFEKAKKESPVFLRRKAEQYGEKMVVNGLRCFLGYAGGRVGGARGAYHGQKAGKEVGEIICKYYNNGDFQKAITDQAMGHLSRPVRDVTDLALMVYREQPDELVINSAKQKTIGYIPHKGAQDLTRIALKIYEGQEPEKVAQDYLIQKAKEEMGKGEAALKRELTYRLCADKL